MPNHMMQQLHPIQYSNVNIPGERPPSVVWLLIVRSQHSVLAVPGGEQLGVSQARYAGDDSVLIGVVAS